MKQPLFFHRGLRLSERSETALKAYHGARANRFHRGLFPLLLFAAVVGLWLLAKQLAWF